MGNTDCGMTSDFILILILEIPYLFINFTANTNHIHLMKRFTAHLTVLLPAIMSLILIGCNVTYHSSLPSSPLKIAQSDEPRPDVMPKFNGGDPKTEFPKWTYENLDYPEEANDARASGTAIVQFTVNPDGTLSDIYVLDSPHYSITAEILRIFSESPVWTPAYLDGEPTSIVYNFPITFRLPDPTRPPRPLF